MEEYEKRTKAKVSGMSEGILEIRQDHDNIVTGWHHAREAPLVNEIGKYVFTISAYFQSRGLNSEAEQTFAHALRVLDSSSLPESVSIRVRLMTHYGWFLQTSNQLQLACQVLQEARELSIMLDRAHIADAGLLQGFLASAFALNNQFDAGRRNAQQALATCYAANFQSGVWICLTILGQVEHGEGIHKKAYQYHHQALTHAEQHQNLYGTIQSLGDLGCVSWALGNVKETSNYLRRGLSLMRAFFIVDTVLLTILGIAGIYERNGRPKIALELLAILLHHSQSGTPVLGPTLRLLLRRLQSQLSVEQVGKVLEMAKEGRLTSNYIDPQFAISPELVDRLSELLDEAAKI